MPRALRLILAGLVAALLLAPAAAPAPAEAATGPCLPEYPHGAQCHVWKGKARWVDDGDTLDADVPGDGLGGVLRIRLTGIQAMEQTVYRAAQRKGDCHAVEATNHLERLIKRSKKQIRVSSLYPESRSRGRRLRWVAVRYGRRWHDVGRIQLAAGNALWWPVWREDAANARYAVLAQRAAIAQRGVFSPNACGLGPDEGHPIKLWANWDADGDDSQNINGEWIKIRNLDPVNPLPLGGWYLRDASLQRFTFPTGAGIPPGGDVTLYAGQGGGFGTMFYWGLPRPLFGNVSYDDRGMGDGAYLFDPQGDIRASMVYPCRVRCSDPNHGRLQVHVQPRRNEVVSIRNAATWPIDLESYQLKRAPYRYSFPGGSVLQPGETMRVFTRGDPTEDTRLDKHWGMTGGILRDRGDTVRIVSYTDVTLACAAWGSRSC
jgi:endonuclease YncB( thermonuclease family)